ncbi:acid protease [Auriculariales sp. MPI-PUGE-AT-0066]|nr:acid protease [Auriculariales sp. MPI-PUGE-AT-0066]
MKIPAGDPTVTLSPSNGQWISVGANGALGGDGKFLIGDKDKGVITFKFPVASSTFEFHAWQRSDGGNATVSIDGGKPAVISYHNATSSGDDGPIKLYSKSGLANKIHTVVIKNVLDKRTNSYGQLNVDSFWIRGVPPTPKPPVFPKNPKMTEAEMEYSYHVKLAVRRQELAANGGNGDTVTVLFDSGATTVWLNWEGCTEPECQELTPYHPSSKHFKNLTIEDTIAYGPGGPENTMRSWRVQDTVTMGSLTIPSTTFGAAFDLPGSQPFDGNFGMGKSYCNGKLCTDYPALCGENMYDAKIITAPVVSYYQLAHNDEHPVAIKSVAQIGGIDRRKFKGSMDWTFVNSDSMWKIPHSKRYIKTAKGKTIDLTESFTHPVLTLDTGSPGLVGLPTSDWNILVKQAGAKQDDQGNWRFPCKATMTWNFHGSQGRDYTFPLGKAGTDDGTGFCDAGPDDSGPTTNWICGAQFLDQYYVAWYFGEHGVGSVLGFAQKNVNLAALKMQPVVGIAECSHNTIFSHIPGSFRMT